MDPMKRDLKDAFDDMARELKLGLERFCALRWKVKGPILALIALIILGGIGAALGTDDQALEADSGHVGQRTTSSTQPPPSITSGLTTSPSPTAGRSRSGTTTPTTSTAPAATSISTPLTPTAVVDPNLTSAVVTRVVDGDTIEVRIDGVEYTVRYIGVDTPETVHPSRPVGCFGPEASAFNKQLVQGQTVGLEQDISETDQFGRLLRYVYLGSEMVNSTLVREGYAQVSTFPPDVKYQDLFLDLQREARDNGRGLWGATCASPTAAPIGGSGVDCPDGAEFSVDGSASIKGNINAEGVRIYHVPGQQYYDRTVINEASSERWFCTEAEALDAGWRKSRV